MPSGEAPSRRQLLALFSVSAILLAHQVWLTRMIAIQHWYHLAPLVIAIALLGFGGAGILVARQAGNITRHRQHWLLAPTLLLGPGMMAGVLLCGLVPLNMLALPWQSVQIGLLAIYALCLLPAFFFGALFVSTCFICWPQRAGRVYAMDMLGGAVGALGVLPLIHSIGLERALLVLSLLSALTGLVLAGARNRSLVACGLTALAVLAGYPQLQLAPAEYKAQPLRQLERGSRLLLQIDGLGHRFTVLDSPGMHAAPGLSLGSSASAPRQWQWFTDGDSPVPLLLPPLPSSDFYQQLLGFAPYALLPAPQRVLILDVGALWHAWIARAAGAGVMAMTAEDVEVIDLLNRLKTRQPAGIYPDGMALIRSSPRRYLAFTSCCYDIVMLTVDSPEAGMAATQENYTLTRQGLKAAYQSLSADGLLVIEVQLHSIPRETLKLVSMLADMLNSRERPPPAHMAIVRDWRTAMIMVGASALNADASDRLRAWARQHQFDLVALPGLVPGETNRYHRLSQDYHGPVSALLSGSADTGQYLFDLSAATDDRPFFFRFFRWQSLHRWLEATGPLWRQHLDWGYLLGLCTLLVGALLATALLILPFRLTFRPHDLRRRAIAYFLAIGFGFMFVEIGLLQKLSLLLDGAAVSMSAVLAAMLAGAGAGSHCQQHWQPGSRAMFRVLVVVALSAIIAPQILEMLFSLGAGWSLALRLGHALLLIFLISLPMGFALPHAISRLQTAAPATIAWLWALNGFASVLGTLGAGLIAVHAGLTAVMILAACCYLGAALSLKNLELN